MEAVCRWYSRCEQLFQFDSPVPPHPDPLPWEREPRSAGLRLNWPRRVQGVHSGNFFGEFSPRSGERESGSAAPGGNSTALGCLGHGAEQEIDWGARTAIMVDGW